MDSSHNINYIESLCKLHLMLAYEGAGNYTKFSEVVKKSGLNQFVDDKFLVYSVMQALSIQGVLGLDWSSSGVKWYVNDFSCDPYARHVVFGHNLFDNLSEKGSIYFSNHPLAFKAKPNSPEFSDCISGISDIGSVTDNVLMYEPNIGQVSDVFEYYSIELGKWIESDYLGESNSIIRTREKYYGYKYFLYFPDIKMLYRFTNSEWLFAVGAYMCGFNINDIFFYNDGAMEINGSFRLPRVIGFHLYLNSEILELGYKNRYMGLSEKGKDTVLHYFKTGGFGE